MRITNGFVRFNAKEIQSLVPMLVQYMRDRWAEERDHAPKAVALLFPEVAFLRRLIDPRREVHTDQFDPIRENMDRYSTETPAWMLNEKGAFEKFRGLTNLESNSLKAYKYQKLIHAALIRFNLEPHALGMQRFEPDAYCEELARRVTAKETAKRYKTDARAVEYETAAAKHCEGGRSLTTQFNTALRYERMKAVNGRLIERLRVAEDPMRIIEAVPDATNKIILRMENEIADLKLALEEAEFDRDKFKEMVADFQDENRKLRRPKPRTVDDYEDDDYQPAY